MCNHLSVSTQARCRAMCAITYLFQHRQIQGNVCSHLCFNTGKMQGNVCNHLSVSTQAKCRAMCAITSLFQHRQNAGQCVPSPFCFNTKCRMTFAITCFNTGKVQGNVCNHLSVSTQAKCRAMCANHLSVSTQENARECVQSPICFNTGKCKAMCAIICFNTGKVQGNVCNHLSVSTQAKCRAMCAITSLFQHRQSTGGFMQPQRQ